MASYCDAADFAAYVEGWVLTDAAALERLLKRAERDIDTLVGDYTVEANGLKFGYPKTTNAKALTVAQVAALSRATCAQAEYRFEMGEDFFIRAQYSYVSGPDFQRRGELPRIGPKVLAELADCGLKLAVPIAT